MNGTTLSQRLTAEFYAFERRGRGWQIWPGPVVLEPPFVQFSRQIRGGHTPDDGRIPGLLDIFGGLFRGRPEPPPRPPSEAPEPSPESDEGLAPVTGLQLRLPIGADVSTELAERLVAALASSARRVSFELVGSADGVVLQFAVPVQSVAAASRVIETYVPEVVIEAEDALGATWGAGAHPGSVVVDFGLSAEFMLPLATRRSFAVDPLLAFLAVLGGLEDGEVGVVQVLMESAASPWAETSMRALTSADGSPFFADAPETITFAKQKFSSPLLAAVVRVGARSGTRDGAWELARRLGGALGQFSQAGINELIPLSDDEYPMSAHEEDLLQRRSRRSGMLVTAAELASLVHPPASSVQFAELRTTGRATKAVPESLRTGDILLGENLHRGRREPVHLRREDRLRHMHIIGATGTGKSTLLLSMLRQDIEAGRGVGLLDPHGDLADAVMGVVPKERVADVVLFDPADDEFPVGLNVLRAHSERERELLASDLVAIFKRFSSAWSDQMTAVLGNAVVALLEIDVGGTLLDLRRLLSDAEFRRSVASRIRDPYIARFWTTEFSRLIGRPSVPLLTRMDAFLRPRRIRHIVAQNESRLDLARVMDTGGVFIARLSQGSIGEENAHLLGSLLVAKFHQLALGREGASEENRRPFFLYLDEFHHFVTPSLGALLAGARKYRLGLTMAHQDLRQLGDQELRSAVLTNAGVRVCFRLGDDDARVLSGGFASFDAQNLQSLGVGEAVCRVGRADHDFNLSVPATRTGTPHQEQIDAIRATARREYGMPRAKVETAIAESFGLESADPLPAPPPPVKTPQPARAAPPPALEQPPVSPPPKAPAPSPGRGGARHKYLQSLIKEYAEGKGYRATIEATVGEAGRVDVLLERDGERIACEISVTTEAAHEVRNLRKCLDADIGRVAVISPGAARLKSIRKMAEGELGPEALACVAFYAPEEFLQTLDGERESVETVHGYRVKTRIMAGSAADADSRSRTIAETIAQAMRRLKKV